MDHDEKAVKMEPIQAAQALDFSLMALFARASLTVQVVMVLLIIASVWAWAIIIQKFLAFSQARREAARHDHDPVLVRDDEVSRRDWNPPGLNRDV